MENYLNLEQSKAIRSLRYKYFTFKVKSQPEYYWVNMSAYKREYELMEAELAEYVSDGCTWSARGIVDSIPTEATPSICILDATVSKL